MREVDVPDVRRVYTLFLDEKRSVSYLRDSADEFIGDDGRYGKDAPVAAAAVNGANGAPAPMDLA